MKHFLFIFIFLVLLVSSISCTMQEEWRTSEPLELRQLVNKEIHTTSISSSFFLIAGSYSSTEHFEEKVKVMAKVNGYYRYLQFPLDKVRIAIDDSITIPYIRIQYEKGNVKNLEAAFRYMEYDWMSKIQILIHCPARYLPEKLIPIEIH
tara:strand:- start:5755 stop:6204 length:450 start_codon:yes stop_codon:yes gene_type:complete